MPRSKRTVIGYWIVTARVKEVQAFKGVACGWNLRHGKLAKMTCLGKFGPVEA